MDREETRRKLEEIIETISDQVENGPGWYAVWVGDQIGPAGPVPPFIYTVAMTRSWLPELIISGHLEPELGQKILSDVILRLRSGEISYEAVPASGLCLSGLLENDLDIFLRRVTGAGQHSRLPLALEYQRRQGGKISDVLSLQIVLPDQENLFPWEGGHSGRPQQEELWN